MNTKSIIAILVGGVLLFVWQFLSWTIFNIHGGNQKYTAKQNEIIQFLDQNLEGEGSYFLPNFPPGTSQEEQQAKMEALKGTPWVAIAFHKSMDMNMGVNMARGLVINFVAIGLLLWVLMQFANKGFKEVYMASLFTGLISYFTGSYTFSIWYETNSIPDLIDAIASWSLVGLWLGYYISKK